MSLDSHALVEAIPPINGKQGRPLSKPRVVQGDRGYDHDNCRRPQHAAGIATEIARRGIRARRHLLTKVEKLILLAPLSVTCR
jgi:hypothetical protein